ncbi:MAG TPA: DUF4743 domain-containing protein [Leucothrix sp.]|nr:DUF4743 domain-containing protein [Leucothrix sp.]
MHYLDHIRNCNTFTPDQYLPFFVGNEQLGWTKKSFAEKLKPFDRVFSVTEKSLALNDTLDTPQERSEVIAAVLKTLHKEGVIDSWVDELYGVTLSYGEIPRFLMERAAVTFFGVRGYGVHINGLVKKADGVYIWVARRTSDKPFWPGMLDQMVAGGQPADIGRMENVIKESAEEANIPFEVAKTAELVSTLHYRGETHRGMSVDTLFNYDLWLPEDFIPENTDGEVDEFILMSLEEMAQITDTTKEFKDNCNLVNIDLLLRLGLINKSHSNYKEITSTLYAPAN